MKTNHHNWQLALLFVASCASGCRCRGAKSPKGATNTVADDANDTNTPAPPPEQLAIAGAGQALTHVTTDPIDEYGPVLSPDGTSLLFTTRVWEQGTDPASGNQVFTGNMSQQAIVGGDPGGAGGRTIYTSAKSLNGSPSWLPNGNAFVYVSNGMGSWNLVRSLSRSPNAGVAVVVRGDIAPGLAQPKVSPDGKRVAFQMTVSDSTYVGVANMDGTSFTQLTEGTRPSWSPDGSRLTFVRQVGTEWQVFTADARTGDELTQVTNVDAQSDAPSYSPNGEYLVFCSNLGWNKFPNGSADHTYNLYAIKVDGTSLTQITDGARDTCVPYWGSDGWIYFESNESGNYDIWRLQPQGELAGTPKVR